MKPLRRLLLLALVALTTTNCAGLTTPGEVTVTLCSWAQAAESYCTMVPGAKGDAAPPIPPPDVQREILDLYLTSQNRGDRGVLEYAGLACTWIRAYALWCRSQEGPPPIPSAEVVKALTPNVPR